MLHSHSTPPPRHQETTNALINSGVLLEGTVNRRTTNYSTILEIFSFAHIYNSLETDVTVN